MFGGRFKVGSVEAFTFSFKVLTLNVVYPSKFDKKSLRIFYAKNAFLRVVSFTLFSVLAFFHLLKIKRDNIEEVEISEDAVVISGGIGVVLVMIFFSVKWRGWTKLSLMLLDFSKFGRPAEMEDCIKRLKNFSKIYGAYYFVDVDESIAIIGTVGYGIASWMEAPNCHRINEEHDYNLICDTFVPIWLPFDVPNKRHRQVIFVLQFFLINTAVSTAAMVCYLTWECTEILAVHIHHLVHHFRKVIVKRNIRTRSDGFGYCIRYHNHILNMALSLQHLEKWCTGHLTFISAIVIGCTEYQLLTSKPIGAIIFLIGWISAIFMICHAGQRLMDETKDAAPALFASDWYLADPKVTRDMILLLLRAQKPVSLAALPLGNADYALLLMIIRTSYSYLTLMNGNT